MIFTGTPSSVTTNLFPIHESRYVLIHSGLLSFFSAGYTSSNSSPSPVHTTLTVNDSPVYMCSLPLYGLPNINTATSTTSTSLTSEYTGAVMAGAYVCLKGYYEQAGIDYSGDYFSSIWNSELAKYAEPWEDIVKNKAGWGRLNLAYNELPHIVTPTEMILNLANVVEDLGGVELEHYFENGIPKVSTVRNSRRKDFVNKF